MDTSTLKALAVEYRTLNYPLPLICSHLDISKTTLWRWMQEDEQFASDFKYSHYRLQSILTEFLSTADDTAKQLLISDLLVLFVLTAAAGQKSDIIDLIYEVHNSMDNPSACDILSEAESSHQRLIHYLAQLQNYDNSDNQ